RTAAGSLLFLFRWMRRGNDGGDERLFGPEALRVRVAVDDDLAEEVQQLGGAVAAGLELEQLRRRVDQRGRGLAGAELRVGDDVFEERDVRLHAADPEFAERPAGAVERAVEGRA